MITMIVVASCLRCDWTAGPSGDWDGVERAANRHLAKGHPTAVTATPAPQPRPTDQPLTTP